jgi:hypothetical protein
MAHAYALRTSDLDTEFFHTDMKVLADHFHGQPTVLYCVPTNPHLARPWNPEWRGRAGGRRHRGGGVGGGGCARLPSSAAGMRSVSSTRLRCVWTLWAVSGNPSGIPGSTMGLATGTSARLRAGHDVCRAPGSAAHWGRAGRKLADARGRCDRVVSNERRSLHGQISSGSVAL